MRRLSPATRVPPRRYSPRGEAKTAPPLTLPPVVEQGRAAGRSLPPASPHACCPRDQGSVRHGLLMTSAPSEGEQQRSTRDHLQRTSEGLGTGPRILGDLGARAEQIEHVEHQR